MRNWVISGAVLALAACELASPIEPVLSPRVRPANLVPAPVAQVRPTSEESARLRAYLAQVQSSQLSQGLLRQDGGGPDTPFTSDMLARNFEQIVFFDEYASNGFTRGGAAPLRRWERPIRIGLRFGASVPPSQRAADTRDVTRFANRLSRVSRHPISLGNAPNFIVLFASEDDRADQIAALTQDLPGLGPNTLTRLRDLPQDVYCAVAAFDSGDRPNVYVAAVAVIRAENPDLLRLSCIHEELAQGLGLANDSPTARPSIFNDDDEFALLTSHDEALLQMLYDPRLTPGMTLETARPVVRQLAAEQKGEAGPS